MVLSPEPWVWARFGVNPSKTTKNDLIWPKPRFWAREPGFEPDVVILGVLGGNPRKHAACVARPWAQPLKYYSSFNCICHYPNITLAAALGGTLPLSLSLYMPLPAAHAFHHNFVWAFPKKIAAAFRSPYCIRRLTLLRSLVWGPPWNSSISYNQYFMPNFMDMGSF